MRAPGRFASWRVWRRFHWAVWSVVIRRSWALLLALAIYVGLITRADWLVLLLWDAAMLVLFAVLFGVRLGRAYESFETHIDQQIVWDQLRDRMRAAMIEDGATEEEADTQLWAMDLEMDRMRRGDAGSPD